MRRERNEVTITEGVRGLRNGLRRIGTGIEQLEKAETLGDVGKALIELDEGGREIDRNWNARLVLRKREQPTVSRRRS